MRWCRAKIKKWGDLQKIKFSERRQKSSSSKKMLLGFEFVFHHSTFKTWKVLRRWKWSSLGDADSLVRFLPALKDSQLEVNLKYV